MCWNRMSVEIMKTIQLKELFLCPFIGCTFPCQGTTQRKSLQLILDFTN